MRPYSEDLLDQIQAQLAWVTVAQGYCFNINNVQRFDRDDLNTLIKPCAHIYKTKEIKVRSGDSWDVTLEIKILVYLDHQLSDDERTTEVMESEVGADVERAISRIEDDNADTFRATIERLETDLFSTGDSEESVEFGVAVQVTLGYRVDRADPSVPIEP